MIKINSFYPNYFVNAGIAGAAYNIIKGMESPNCQVRLMGIASDSSLNDDFYKSAIPNFAKRISYKILSDKTLKIISESIFLKSISDSDYVYLWPGISLDVHKTVKNSGYKIIYESVNTPASNIKTILDAEYARLKLPAAHGITQEIIAIELKMLELSDYIYSCSPIMTASILDIGMSKSKILDTSYGLSANAIFEDSTFKRSEKSLPPTFIFVGTIGVRKGVHLLLDYWVKAKLNAKLILVGNIEEAIKPIVMSYFNKHNVLHIPYTPDLSSIYKSADVFILPSLEEGSPLVTYMALGAGLPVIVSPMGGGGVIVDSEDGFVIEPHDENKWIEHMRLLAESQELREKLSVHSKTKALNYVWNVVGAKRLHSLQKAEGHLI